LGSTPRVADQAVDPFRVIRGEGVGDRHAGVDTDHGEALEPEPSINATGSPAKLPVSYPSGGLADSPIPRWSTATTWKSRARVGISSRDAYQVCGQSCTSSSGRPAAAHPVLA
jgi:hypothetical protein